MMRSLKERIATDIKTSVMGPIETGGRIELAELLLKRYQKGPLSQNVEQRIAELMLNISIMRFLNNTTLGQKISHWLSIENIKTHH